MFRSAPLTALAIIEAIETITYAFEKNNQVFINIKRVLDRINIDLLIKK